MTASVASEIRCACAVMARECSKCSLAYRARYGAWCSTRVTRGLESSATRAGVDPVSASVSSDDGEAAYWMNVVAMSLFLENLLMDQPQHAERVELLTGPRGGTAIATLLCLQNLVLAWNVPMKPSHTGHMAKQPSWKPAARVE